MMATTGLTLTTQGLGRSAWGYPQYQWQAQRTQTSVQPPTPAGGLVPRRTVGSPTGGAYTGEPGSPYVTVGPAGQAQTAYVPYPRQTPEEAHAERMAGLQEALLRQQLDQNRLAAELASMGGGVPTTRLRAVGAGSATGGELPERPAPSLSQIREAMERIQPTAPAAPTLPARIAPPTSADTSAARALAYGRAKDTIAGEHAAAARALETALTARGLTGTGLEARGRRDLARASLAALANIAAQQAAEEAALQNRLAELGYQGNLSQRGQDINAMLGRYNAQLGLLPNPLGYIPAITGLYQAGGGLY
ncbi:MAG: hypothetical protein QN178_14060 [Armatimonadota bacterium]|nr:hypothetical protein [Armatimonadota bacterium]